MSPILFTRLPVEMCSADDKEVVVRLYVIDPQLDFGHLPVDQQTCARSATPHPWESLKHVRTVVQKDAREVESHSVITITFVPLGAVPELHHLHVRWPCNMKQHIPAADCY